MDYMMPGMDGVKTLHAIQSQIPDFTTPVVALTADTLSGTREELLKEGFTAYLTKPIISSDFEKAISSLIPREYVTGHAAKPQSSPVSKDVKEAISRELAKGGVELDEGLKNASGHWPLLAAMADAFWQGHEQSHAQMQSVLSGKNAPDLEALRHYTHSLKSSSRFVGAMELSHHAKLIEQACKDADRERITLAMPLMYLEWDRARAVLEAFSAQVHAMESSDDRRSGGGR
jgi:CheY-like chemotaxis protein